MSKDYIFIEKKTNYPFWVSIVAILLLVGLVGKMEKEELLLKREIKLRKDMSVHQWIMPDECSDMLLNSQDHTLRIKLNKLNQLNQLNQ